MRVGAEGVTIADFEPDSYIKVRFEEKVRKLNGAKPRNYPSKRRSVASSSKSGYVMIDIASATLSDLESSDDEFLTSKLYSENFGELARILLFLPTDFKIFFRSQ